MRVTWLDTATSTNTLMAAESTLYGHGHVLAARSQTAGRGQRGNTWEAAPGLNLTFSLMLRPTVIRPADAFAVSMLVSIGIVRALGSILGSEPELKWPNDVYVGDRKLAGILIENSFSGSGINHSIVGIGLNVNQLKFVSDAPNPVSMARLSGHTFELDEVLRIVVSEILEVFGNYETSPDIDSLTHAYNSRLWRRKGVWPWYDCIAGEPLRAAISHVSSTGHLTLATNPPRTYAFKEVRAELY